MINHEGIGQGSEIGVLLGHVSLLGLESDNKARIEMTVFPGAAGCAVTFRIRYKPGAPYEAVVGLVNVARNPQ